MISQKHEQSSFSISSILQLVYFESGDNNDEVEFAYSLPLIICFKK